MLTRAQRKAGKAILDAICEYGAVLAGGAAMNEAHLINRPTTDLDFFTNDLKAELRNIASLAADALAEIGMETTLVQSSPHFVKLYVDAGKRSSFEVEFGFDSIEYETVVGAIGPRLCDKELAVNKILAAFGRIAPRDIMDLASLDGHFDWAQLFDGAKAKDGGFNLDTLSEMLAMNLASKEWRNYANVDDARAFGQTMIDKIIPDVTLLAVHAQTKTASAAPGSMWPKIRLR